MKTIYYLALGSNLGARRRNLCSGLLLLSRHGSIRSVSSVYITRPVVILGPCENFFNMVCKYESTLRPERLLCLCKAIEGRCGRPPFSHNQPRTLDIDILLAGSRIIESARLQIPHKGIEDRPFVLLPMLEIDASLRAPGSNIPYHNYLMKQKKTGVLGRFKLSDHCVTNR